MSSPTTASSSSSDDDDLLSSSNVPYYWGFTPKNSASSFSTSDVLAFHSVQIEFKIRDTEPKIYRQRISKEDLDSRIALLRERYHNRPEILRQRIAALMKQYT